MRVHRISAFTEGGVGGNPAGVVLIDSLPDASDMQRIAAEVGYSETVFAARQDEVWKTRYFSPESEVPFCGHATIALGAVLATEVGAGRYELSLLQGQIQVEAHLSENGGQATLRSPPTRSAEASRALVDEALALFGYAPDALDATLPPYRMNAGAEHLLLALKSREALSHMQYDLQQGRDFMRRHGLVTVALVWREAEDLFHARNAFASGGVIEDPATGAAAAALAGMLRDRGVATSGALTILQGHDMGRPSRIEVRYDQIIGSPVWVSGAAHRIV